MVMSSQPAGCLTDRGVRAAEFHNPLFNVVTTQSIAYTKTRPGSPLGNRSSLVVLYVGKIYQEGYYVKMWLLVCLLQALIAPTLQLVKSKTQLPNPSFFYAESYYFIKKSKTHIWVVIWGFGFFHEFIKMLF